MNDVIIDDFLKGFVPIYRRDKAKIELIGLINTAIIKSQSKGERLC